MPSAPAPTSRPTFSAPPTDAEITRAAVFADGLTPLAGTAREGENQALADALIAYRASNDPDRVLPFEQYLQQQPDSRWVASVPITDPKGQVTLRLRSGSPRARSRGDDLRVCHRRFDDRDDVYERHDRHTGRHVRL